MTSATMMTLETRNFEFRVFGDSISHANTLMTDAIGKHCAEHDVVVADFFASYPPDEYWVVTRIRIGEAYRDRELILSEVSA